MAWTILTHVCTYQPSSNEHGIGTLTLPGGLRERPVPTKRVERIGPGGTKQEEGVSNF